MVHSPGLCNVFVILWIETSWSQIKVDLDLNDVFSMKENVHENRFFSTSEFYLGYDWEN